MRVFFVGGLTSYRALFGWLSPWILIPTFLIAPLFQILLFTYIGRAAALESDEFFVIGNAVQYAASPCVFAMTTTIAGERGQRTLQMVLGTPARRAPLFLGRALPVIANGFVVSAFALVAGVALLGIDVAAGSAPLLALVIAICAFSCTGLGVIGGAIGIRVRETAVLSNIVFAILLIFCGVNVPLDELPNWMSTIAQGLPFTHGIEAARDVANGASLDDVADLLGAEFLLGVVYIGIGLLLLRFFEHQGRVHATLERA